MNLTRSVLLAILALVALVVLWLARANRLPPALPADRTHAAFVGADLCLACHGPQGVRPQPRSHPVGRDCTRCHAGR